MSNFLIFPRRGDPPPDQPGYEREKGDPFVFHRIWVPCVHRFLNKLSNCGGCKSKGVTWCQLLDLPVDQSVCNTCKEDKSGNST